MLGPTDAWPQHPRPQAAAALEEARRAGWWFKELKGHAFGRLRCRPPDGTPDQEACKVLVYSTSGASDGSDTATLIRDAVRKCRHTREAQLVRDPEGDCRLALGRLAQADAILRAADVLMTQWDMERLAGESLEEGISRLEADPEAPIEDVEDRAEELEDTAQRKAGEAYAAAVRGGMGDPWPPERGIDELVEQAGLLLEEAGELVARAVGAERHPKAAAELERLREGLRRILGRSQGGR